MQNKGQKSIKGNDSSESTATTSSEVKNNLKFIDLSFLGDSDHSEKSETHGANPPKLPIRNVGDKEQKENINVPPHHQINLQSLMNKSQPQQPIPNLTNELHKAVKKKTEIMGVEKNLQEIGFKPNDIDGWENIIQPRKENLYTLLKKMIDLYIKPNIQIRIGEVSFNCHMMVLQCYSGFFMECSNEVVIQLPEERITPKAFMMVYDWMLASEPLIQREGILELFNAANFLKIDALVDQCWVCLDDDLRFQEDTAFLLYLEARVYGLEMLQQLMMTRVCKFFLTLVASSDFLSLSAAEICFLLHSNSIGVNTEVEILMAAVRWLCHDWNTRKSDMIEVIRCVRFELIPPWILVALGRDFDGLEIVVQDPVVKKMIEDGLSYTTTQLFYADKVDNFLASLERYKLNPPVPRQWIYDEDCVYHHDPDCPNKQYITFESFLTYLDMLRTKGKDHWKTLRMEIQGGSKFQCCKSAAK